ncbi:MAG: H/ACA ribonucleoprotein complex subunit NOP10 [Candidatus Heimdallarchaeaceae archaeon]
MKTIKKCGVCKRYTLNPVHCPYCNGKTISPHPARFSLEKEQKYSQYRRQLIKDSLKHS